MLTVHTALRARLAELDSAIFEHRLRIQELEDIRKPVQQELDRVVYPVLTLPSEIMSEIFYQCLPLRGPTSTYSFDTLEAPLLLLQVCATWRSIAISTPRLWSHLHLYVRRPPIQTEMKAVVDDWFSRAGCSPLSFSLNDFQDGSDIVEALVRRHASRLQSVAFRLTKDHFIKMEGAGPFSLLEELDISLPFYGGGLGPVPRPTIFDDAPRLRQLTFRGSASPSDFHLSYLHLSKFTCSGMTAGDFLNLMRDAPLLEDCTCAITRHQTVTIWTQVVTHERLQTLRFYESSTEILRLLSLPALENLHFKHVFNTGSDGDYIPLLASCSASLRRFHVEIGCDLDLRVEWFSSLPGLTDVMVYNPSREFSSGFFSKLDRAHDSGFLLHLQSLAFENCATNVDSSLLQALTSRCSSPHDEANLQLRTFRLLWPDNKPSLRLDDFTVADLRRLVDQGMDIYVGPRRKNLI